MTKRQLSHEYGSALEASLSKDHRYHWSFEILRGSMATMAIGFARLIPNSVVRKILLSKKRDALPFKSVRSTDVADTHGYETLVYYRPKNDENSTGHVVKISSGHKSVETDLRNRKAGHELYLQYYGSMVLPKQLLILESPYEPGRSVVGEIQTFVPDLEPLISALDRVDIEQLQLFYENTLRMIEQESKIPDIFSGENTSVNSNGDIVIIDTGHLYDKATFSIASKRRLDKLMLAITERLEKSEKSTRELVHR